MQRKETTSRNKSGKINSNRRGLRSEEFFLTTNQCSINLTMIAMAPIQGRVASQFQGKTAKSSEAQRNKMMDKLTKMKDNGLQSEKTKKNNASRDISST